MNFLASDRSSLEDSLRELRDVLGRVAFPLKDEHFQQSEVLLQDVIHQCDDYLLPRLEHVDAPLVAVVGGSTGSGKSSLVNALVGQEVAKVSAIRPTTRHGLLLHSPSDTEWFESEKIFPGFTRLRSHTSRDGRGIESSIFPGNTESSEDCSHVLEMVELSSLPEGLALLDAPDIDSVVENNRKLAAQLMSAADMWIFVTTAARYADAIPWAMLDEASSRNVVIAVVLNRIPPGTGAQVRADLVRRLEERGLGNAPLFMIAEHNALPDSSGISRKISEQDVAAVRDWLTRITDSKAARVSVARQTLLGAIQSTLTSCSYIVESLEAHNARVKEMENSISSADTGALQAIMGAVEEGKILRGEVLHRWNKLVRTGALMQSLESKVSKTRDRLGHWLRGARPLTRTAMQARMEKDIVEAFKLQWIAEAEQAIRALNNSWRLIPGASVFLDEAHKKIRTHEEREAACTQAISAWRKNLARMVAEQGEKKLARARALSIGVNTVGAALMIVVFAASAGLTGAEAAIAGGTAVASQRLLEAVFGDEAVRSMTQLARKDLSERIEEFIGQDLRPFREICAEIGSGGELPRAIHQAQAKVEEAYQAEKKR